MGHVVHSSASGYETSMYYSSCSGGPAVVSMKSTSGHVTPNLFFFLHSVGLAGHVVHSDASGA
jgi:hypothetical protein